MTAKICADIKPSGLAMKDEVDLYYQIISSLKGICAKLDDDGGVTSTTYEANVYTAIFNGYIEDSKGNILINRVAAKDHAFQHITPRGITDKDRLELFYDVLDMLETLTEQLDGDSLGDTDYEALCYTALVLKMVTNQRGQTLGNGNTFWFNPGGASPKLHLVDLHYQLVNTIATLTAKLDDDGTVTDTDYEALWYTANILLTVENSAASRIGN